MGDSKSAAIMDSNAAAGRLGRLGRRVAVEMRWQFAPSAGFWPSSAKQAKAQQSPAELLNSSARVRSLFFRELSASCLQQESWICTFEYPSYSTGKECVWRAHRFVE